MSNDKVNKYLKRIFQELGMDRKVRKKTFENGNVKMKIEKLSDVISFHKARHTFVTLALRKGIGSEVIKKLTGHKKEENFSKYLKFTDDDKTKAINILDS